MFPTLDTPGSGVIAPDWTPDSRRRRPLIIGLTTLAFLLVACVAGNLVMRGFLETEAPQVPAINVHDALVDSTPVVVTFLAGTEPIE